jgi:hypothetical protein
MPKKNYISPNGSQYSEENDPRTGIVTLSTGSAANASQQKAESPYEGTSSPPDNGDVRSVLTPPQETGRNKYETTITMLSPDGMSGEIPMSNVESAKKAGFKIAVTMKSPDGSTGYIPTESVHDAVAKGFKMVPMDVPEAAKPSYWDALTNPVGSGGREQGVVGGALQIGGQAIKALVQPVAHPLDTIEGAYNAVRHPIDTATGMVNQVKSDYQQGGVPLAAENLAGQTIGAVEGGRIAAPVARAAVDTAKNIGNPVTAVKNVFAGPPEVQMTKALQPGKNNVNFSADLKTALPQMKSAEAQLGNPIEGFDDAVQANVLAKKNIWKQVQSRLSSAGQAGAMIDGNQIADAMMGSVDKRMAIQNPGVAARIKDIANTYRRDIPVDEAEDFIQSNNHELTGYYARNKISQQAAQSDPEVAAKIAEGDALRQALYSRIDSLFGPGVAQLKKTYGALSNVQKELAGQQIIYARKAPANLGEQLSYFQAAGKALTGDLVGAAKDVAVRRFLSDLNDKNSMIARSFAKVQPATPFPQPTIPKFSGLLESGPIRLSSPDTSGIVDFTPPPYSYDTAAARLGRLLPEQSSASPTLPYYPEMSAGERLAALHQLWRQKQQLALPAQSQPIRLPSSSK